MVNGRLLWSGVTHTAFGRRKRSRPVYTGVSRSILTVALLLGLFLFAPGAWGAILEGQTTRVPWSGHWWPFQGGGLARGYGGWGHPAPLEKYELVAVGFYPWLATDWELANHYDPDALDWEGLCYARAAAASVEPEPEAPSVYHNVLFRIGDKKGLLTSLYTDAVTELGAGSDPVRFHTWLLHYVGELDTPVVVDMDPGVEIWYYPVYKYRMQIDEEGSVRHVSCRIWYTASSDPDFQGAVIYSDEYTYDLYVDSHGDITGGRWTGGSESNHPGRMFVVLEEGAENPYLDSTLVHQIAQSVDDELEDEEPADLGPGSYPLVLMDTRDSFNISCAEGTPVSLRVENEGGEAHPLRVEGSNGEGGLLFSEAVADDWSIGITCPDTGLAVSVERMDGSQDPIIYSITLDSHGQYEYVFPVFSKNNYWAGFSVVNTGPTPLHHVRVAGYTSDGEPVRTVWGPVTLMPGERRVFLLSDLLWAHERAQVDQVRINSPGPLAFINLFGRFGEFMAGLGPSCAETASSWIAADTGYGTRWRVWALDGASGQVRIHSRGADGADLGEEVWDLSPSALVHNGYDTSPAGWARVDSDVPVGVVSYWEDTGTATAEAVVNVSPEGKEYVVPHLAVGGAWTTELVLINPSDAPLDVTVRLKGAAQSVERAVSVGPNAKKKVDVGALFSGVSPAVFQDGVLEVNGSDGFGGYVNYRTSRIVASVPLLERSRASTVLVVPHVASSSYWWTGIAVANAGEASTDVAVEGYDQAGNLLESVSFGRLEPGEKRAATVRDLFSSNQVPNLAWLRIEGQEPLLGVLIYGGVQGTEVAGVPLWGMAGN